MSSNPKQHRFREPGTYLVTFQAIQDQTRAQVLADGRVMIQTPHTEKWHEVDPEQLAESATATFKIEGATKTP